MSSKIFEFYIESGLFLKNLSDILLLCSEKTCTMDISSASINFSKLDKSFTENDCKVSIKLDTSYLTSFYLLSPITVALHVKYFSKLCKTLKKRDKVTLWIERDSADKDSSLHIETKEEILGVQKVEEKEMPITILYDCKSSDIPSDTDSHFSTSS